VDARTVLAAALIAAFVAVGFIAGAASRGGVDPRLVGNAGVGLGAIAIGLAAGSRLFLLVERLESKFETKFAHQEARYVQLENRFEMVEGRFHNLELLVLHLMEEVGAHKQHDQDALAEAAGLETTGPHSVRSIRKP